MKKVAKTEFEQNMQHIYTEIQRKADDRQVSEDVLKLKFEIQRLEDRITRLEQNVSISTVVRHGC